MINPHSPGPDMAAGTCQFRLFKNNPNVCQVRVDFVDTELLTPQNGNCVDQYLTISGTIWPTGFNRICGINPDQHFTSILMTLRLLNIWIFKLPQLKLASNEP